MARKYFTVVVRDTRNSAWEIHFGDYSKAVADQEKLDVLENDDFGYAKVITTGDAQSDIEAAVKYMNRDLS